MPRISVWLTDEDRNILIDLARDSDESISKTVASGIHILNVLAGGLLNE